MLNTARRYKTSCLRLTAIVWYMKVALGTLRLHEEWSAVELSSNGFASNASFSFHRLPRRRSLDYHRMNVV